MSASRRVKFEPELRKCGHVEVFRLQSAFRHCEDSMCCSCAPELPHSDCMSKEKRREL